MLKLAGPSDKLPSAGNHLSYITPFSSEEDNTLLDVLKSVEPELIEK